MTGGRTNILIKAIVASAIALLGASLPGSADELPTTIVSVRCVWLAPDGKNMEMATGVGPTVGAAIDTLRAVDARVASAIAERRCVPIVPVADPQATALGVTEISALRRLDDGATPIGANRTPE